MFQRSDEGFSLVEVIIAMFLLAVLSLAVLPLLISATRLSVTNRDITAATAYANAQLAPIKAAFPPAPGGTTSCADLKMRESTAGADGMTAAVRVSTCPTGAADYPASIPLTVVVIDAGGDELVSLTTRIPVEAP